MSIRLPSRAFPRLAVGLLLVVFWVVNSPAQDYSNELTGTIGRTFIGDRAVVGTTNAVRFGNGTTFEVNYARHLWGRQIAALSIETPLVFNFDEDINYPVNIVPEGYRSYFLTAAFRVNLFPQTAFSPWISGGGGFRHFTESSELLFGGPNPATTGTDTTSGVRQFGAGFDVNSFSGIERLSRFAVRLEVRDFYCGTPQLNVDIGKKSQHNIYVGGGIIFHF